MNRLKLRTAGIIAAAVIVIYFTLWASGKLAEWLGISKAYLLNDVATTIFAVLTSGAVAIIALKAIFRNTMGKDFGDQFDKGWNGLGGMTAAERTRWMIVTFLVLFLGGILASTARAGTMAGTLPVSDESVQHVLKWEVGGRAYFERFLRHPTVPAPRTTSSGCTFGFGYDVGHTSKERIQVDWKGILTPEEMRLVLSVQGKKGMDAYYATREISDRVLVDWDEAQQVFQRGSLQSFGKLTADAYDLRPGQLHPTQNGLLVSMTFNRGARLDEGKAPGAWDRYMEKRWIKYNVSSGKLDRVPGDFEHMTRLWPNVRGLRLRYFEAATIWRATLAG